MKRSAIALLCVFGLCTGPGVAGASPIEAMGASARSSAMVGALVANAGDADAVFHNVGGLATVEPSVRVGLTLMRDRSVIRLKERPAGYDIPDIGGTGPAVPTVRELEPRSDTTGQPVLGVLNMGVVSSLGIDRLRVGVLVALPVLNGAPQGGFFADERERLFSNRLHYELLGDRVRRYDVRFGLGLRLTERLSLGLGGAWLPTVETRNDVFLQNPTDQENVDLIVEAYQGSRIGLTAGLQYEPAEWLRVGIAVRDAVSMRVEGGNVIRIRGFEEDPETWPVEQRIDLTPFYSPASVSAGVSADIGAWTLSSDATMERWSRYLNRQSEPTDFSDTVSGRLGVEFGYSPDTTVRGGLGYVPSPVPPQTERTNYVDNHRILTAIGASHDVRVFGNEVVVGWFSQVQFLMRRDTDKAIRDAWPTCGPGVTSLCDELPDDLRDPRTGETIRSAAGLQTGNPGFPGFVSGGWLASAGVEVSWRF